MSDQNELRMYRTKLFRDALEMKKPQRVPHLSYAVTWKIFDAGHKLGEALNDYDLMAKIVREHQAKYQFDAMTDYGLRNPYRVSAALGTSLYEINDENDSIFYRTDFTFCSNEELDQLAANPRKFMYEKMMPRKYATFNSDMTAEQFQNVITEKQRFAAYAASISKQMEEEFGLPKYAAPMPTMFLACENLFNIVRGIRGFSLDMRRDKGRLHAVLDALSEEFLTPNIEKLKAMPKGPNYDYCFDGQLFFMAHTVMNNKQYEEFQWPYVKRILDTIVECDKHVRIYVQGKMMDRLADYFKDYPKGYIALHLEGDDLFETRKALPNCALIGGVPADLLGRGTKQECLDKVRSLVEELGKDGGFILSQDKMLTYRNDANPENLKAICDYMNAQ